MSETLLSITSPKEVQYTTMNTLRTLNKKVWNTDTYITGIIDNLTDNYNILENSNNIVRSSDYTERLAKADTLFNSDYICLKNFIESNLHMRDPEKREAAKTLWKIFVAGDLQMHRKSYEVQMASFYSLMNELNKSENYTLLGKLVGVSEAYDLATQSHLTLHQLHAESTEAKAQKEKVIAPYIQGKIVLDIINDDLLPYLATMARVNPDVYGETFSSIQQLIVDANINTRTAETRSKNQKKENEQENTGEQA